jgi:hypothetical protein
VRQGKKKKKLSKNENILKYSSGRIMQPTFFISEVEHVPCVDNKLMTSLPPFPKKEKKAEKLPKKAFFPLLCAIKPFGSRRLVALLWHTSSGNIIKWQ